MEKRTMRRIVTTAIVLILAAGLACFGLVTCTSNTPLEGARVDAINMVLDNTGLKERVDGALRDKARTIAEENGVPYSVLEVGIDLLDIPNWKAAKLPKSADKATTFTLDYGGQDVSITAYDDPSYVTLGAYGQEVTFDIPESAQTFTTLAPLLDNGTGEVSLGDLLTM